MLKHELIKSRFQTIRANILFNKFLNTMFLGFFEFFPKGWTIIILRVSSFCTRKSGKEDRVCESRKRFTRGI